MARGSVDIEGVTTRHNTSEKRTCVGCLHRIDMGRAYERVMRLSGDVESYHVTCFEEEFGTRSNYEPTNPRQERATTSDRWEDHKDDLARRQMAERKARQEGQDREEVRKAIGEGGLGRRG